MTTRPTIFTPAVRRLFEAVLEPAMVEHVHRVARATDHQLAELKKAMTQGDVVRDLALGLGATADESDEMSAVADVIMIAGDLADNIADREEDLARDRGYDGLYDGMPEPVLHCLTATMISAVHTHLVTTFPPHRYGSVSASQHITDIIGQMCFGQGLEETCPEKSDRVSGVACRIYCLPLWLRPDLDPDGSRTAAVESWSFAYGRIWQLYHLWHEHDTPRLFDELTAAIENAEARWPAFTPFLDGERFALGQTLPMSFVSK